MSGLRLKSLFDFYPESTELIRKGVCFPPTASPTQPFLNQDKDFLSFFCSYHNFCYSMSMITALRGASLTPHTRINLLLQQEKRKQGTNIFPQSTKISSLHMEMLKILIFFPCLHSRILSFLSSWFPLCHHTKWHTAPFPLSKQQRNSRAQHSDKDLAPQILLIARQE